MRTKKKKKDCEIFRFMFGHLIGQLIKQTIKVSSVIELEF